jgi:hypothetical protein
VAIARLKMHAKFEVQFLAFHRDTRSRLVPPVMHISRHSDTIPGPLAIGATEKYPDCPN